MNIEGIKYIGHYGMEQWENDRAILHPDAGAYVPAMRAVAKELEPLRSIQGILIQDKGRRSAFTITFASARSSQTTNPGFTDEITPY